MRTASETQAQAVSAQAVSATVQIASAPETAIAKSMVLDPG